jgi:DNA-binding MarR family transcriptional regulator
MPDSKSQPDFEAMAELRYQIRRFIRFSENSARDEGIEPQQQQLLLAIQGLPNGLKPTVGVLAERMQVQHHSAVGLIDRLVDRGLLVRLRATDDKRQVLIKLSHDGEECLRKLALHHLHELQSVGPKFVKVLQGLIDHTVSANKHR